jgi:5-methylcytosine-specific restriction endonuclease McrA
MEKTEIDHIINVLRQGTITWEGRRKCLDNARRHKFMGYTKKGVEKHKFEYQCSACKKWYENRTDLEVDHIKEVGSFDRNEKNQDKLKEMFGSYVMAMYCRQDNLQALCVDCHLNKTSNFNAKLKYTRNDEEGAIEGI